QVRGDKKTVRLSRIQIEDGEQIDFVVDSRSSNFNDDFQWPVEIWTARESDNGDGGLIGVTPWKSVTGFEDGAPSWLPPISPWQQYTQALLISNEIMFVD
ncbi:MAG: hypothetical protein N2C12_15735, partial [Planctomycetales bacterium]